MKISREQRNILREYIPDIDVIVESDDIVEFELALDRAIVENGLDSDGEITKIGVELQRIYDEIFEQNSI